MKLPQASKLPLLRLLQADRTWLSLLLAAAILLFYPALHLGYLFDDYDILSAVTQPGFSLWTAFPAGSGTYFRPLISLSFALVERFATGDAAPLHHALSLAIHLLNMLLVYALCRTLVARRWLAFLLALLFTAHPANVYDVSILNGRVDSLAALFYLLGLLAFAHYLRTGQRRYMGIASLALPAVLLSKEFGITLGAACGILLLIWRRWVDPGLPPARLKTAWMWCLGALLVSLVFSWAVFSHFYFSPVPGSLPFHWHPRDALEALVTFPLLFILPNSQMLLIHIYKTHLWLLPAGIVLAGAVIAAIVWRLVQGSARRGAALVSLLLVLIFIPASLLLLVGGVHSRQLYTPLALGCFSLAILARVYPARLRLIGVLALLYLLLLLPAARNEAHKTTAQAQLRDVLCQDFAALVPASDPNPALILLSPPGFALSNDASTTLYYCQYRRFGAYPRLVALGTLQSEDLPLPAIDLSPNGAHTYTLQVSAKLDFFLLNPGLPLHTPFPLEFGELVLTSRRADGYFNGYQIRLTPDTVRRSYILYFDGEHFRGLSAPP